MTLTEACVFVFDGFSDWETAYAAAEINGSDRFEIITAGASADPVHSMGGFKVLPDLALAELSPDDAAMLILPGGHSWEEEGAHPEAMEAADRFLSAGKPVAAICAATLCLARLGRLDNAPHTSNGLDYLLCLAPDYRGENLYQLMPAVTGGNIITANGTASVEFAREVLIALGVYDTPTANQWYTLFRGGIF